MTVFERKATVFGKAVGEGTSVAGHESIVSFILGGGGRADAMAEDSTCGDVHKMYELMADDEGEDLLSDLTREL